MSETTGTEWHARPRNYVREQRDRRIAPEEATLHPLREITVTVTETKAKRTDSVASSSSTSHSNAAVITDPLSRSFEGQDPLSQFAAEMMSPLSRTVPIPKHTSVKVTGTPPVVTGPGSSFEPWSVKRTGILSRYTTTEKLSIVTILAPTSADRKADVSGTAVLDKVKNRLEQLDDLEEGSIQETLHLSQQEYINRIEVSLPTVCDQCMLFSINKYCHCVHCDRYFSIMC